MQIIELINAANTLMDFFGAITDFSFDGFNVVLFGCLNVSAEKKEQKKLI